MRIKSDMVTSLLTKYHEAADAFGPSRRSLPLIRSPSFRSCWAESLGRRLRPSFLMKRRRTLS